MIEPQPLSRDAFAPFGDVIDASHPNRFEINVGFTTRVHDLFAPEILGDDARVLVNFFLGRPRPLEAAMLERPSARQPGVHSDRPARLVGGGGFHCGRGRCPCLSGPGQPGREPSCRYVAPPASGGRAPALCRHRPRGRRRQPGRSRAGAPRALVARLTGGGPLPRVRISAASPGPSRVAGGRPWRPPGSRGRSSRAGMTPRKRTVIGVSLAFAGLLGANGAWHAWTAPNGAPRAASRSVSPPIRPR